MAIKEEHLPTVFKPIGAPFKRMGKIIVAVERPKGLEPIDACKGCLYVQACRHNMQCSRWDRRDGKNIWFQEVKQ